MLRSTDIFYIFVIAVFSVSHCGAFWWRTNEPAAEPLSQWPHPAAVYYQQRLLKSHPMPLPPHIHQQQQQSQQYDPIAVPAIPIQVPIQAQFSPAPSLHNVQLVPCLCPVQPEEYDKIEQMNTPKKDV